MKTIIFLLIGLLTIGFVILKLSSHIDWSWWSVLSPIWGYILLELVCLIFYILLPKQKPTNKKSGFQQRLEEMRKIQNNTR